MTRASALDETLALDGHARLIAADAEGDAARLAHCVRERAQKLGDATAVEPGLEVTNTFSSVVDLLAYACSANDVLILPTHRSAQDERDAVRLFGDDEHRFRAWKATEVASGSVFGHLSGGSTGFPKVVLTSWRREFEIAAEFAEATDMSPDDVVLCTTPIHHDFALEIGVLASLSAGATVVLAPPIPAFDVLVGLIETHDVSIIQGVPAIFDRLVRGDSTGWQRRLRLCISVGEPLRDRLIAEWSEASDIPLRQEYGTAETGSLAFDRRGATGTVGVPHRGVEVRFDPVADQEFVDDENGPGELVVLGPWESQVNRFGADGQEVVREPITGRWYRTGDVGSRSSTGDLVLTGRRDRIVTLFGYKIDPLQVERAIDAIPGVHASLARVETLRSGSRALRAYVVGSPGLSTSYVLTQLRRQLSREHIPAEVVFVDELPALATGKPARTLRTGLPR